MRGPGNLESELSASAIEDLVAEGRFGRTDVALRRLEALIPSLEHGPDDEVLLIALHGRASMLQQALAHSTETIEACDVLERTAVEKNHSLWTATACAMRAQVKVGAGDVGGATSDLTRADAEMASADLSSTAGYRLLDALALAYDRLRLHDRADEVRTLLEETSGDLPALMRAMHWAGWCNELAARAMEPLAGGAVEPDHDLLDHAVAIATRIGDLPEKDVPLPLRRGAGGVRALSAAYHSRPSEALRLLGQDAFGRSGDLPPVERQIVSLAAMRAHALVGSLATARSLDDAAAASPEVIPHLVLEVCRTRERLWLESYANGDVVPVLHRMTELLVRLGWRNMDLLADTARQALEHQALRAESRTDALTGVGNRRALDEELRQLLRFSSLPLALVLVDVDHFKGVNDRFTHVIGDEVLKRVAQSLQQQLRGEDQLLRYGGDEFVVLLPGTGDQEAHHVAARMSAAVAARPWGELADGLSITVTTGCAAVWNLSGRRPDADAERLFRRADERLLDGKRRREDGGDPLGTAGAPAEVAGIGEPGELLGPHAVLDLTSAALAEAAELPDGSGRNRRLVRGGEPAELDLTGLERTGLERTGPERTPEPAGAERRPRRSRAVGVPDALPESRSGASGGFGVPAVRPAGDLPVEELPVEDLAVEDLSVEDLSAEDLSAEAPAPRSRGSRAVGKPDAEPSVRRPRARTPFADPADEPAPEASPTRGSTQARRRPEPSEPAVARRNPFAPDPEPETETSAAAGGPSGFVPAEPARPAGRRRSAAPEDARPPAPEEHAAPPAAPAGTTSGGLPRRPAASRPDTLAAAAAAPPEHEPAPWTTSPAPGADSSPWPTPAEYTPAPPVTPYGHEDHASRGGVSHRHSLDRSAAPPAADLGTSGRETPPAEAPSAVIAEAAASSALFADYPRYQAAVRAASPLVDPLTDPLPDLGPPQAPPGLRGFEPVTEPPRVTTGPLTLSEALGPYAAPPTPMYGITLPVVADAAPVVVEPAPRETEAPSPVTPSSAPLGHRVPGSTHPGSPAPGYGTTASGTTASGTTGFGATGASASVPTGTPGVASPFARGGATGAGDSRAPSSGVASPFARGPAYAPDDRTNPANDATRPREQVSRGYTPERPADPAPRGNAAPPAPRPTGAVPRIYTAPAAYLQEQPAEPARPVAPQPEPARAERSKPQPGPRDRPGPPPTATFPVAREGASPAGSVTRRAIIDLRARQQRPRP